MKGVPTVSLTINACLTDSPFLEKALRHIFRSLNYPFTERLIAVDKSMPEGGFLKRERDNEVRLMQILERLQSENLFDRIDEVPWSQESQTHIFQKYFNQQNVDPRCSHGTAVYQYLFALNQCKSDYILHVDSDVLFSLCNGPTWIQEGIDWMQENPDVIFVTPMHPPKAETILEFLLGKPLNRVKQKWIFSQVVSTRYFLADRVRMEERLLPLIQKDASERLEQSFNRTLKAKKLFKSTLNTLDSWVIHPKPHNRNYINHLDTLIWAAENHTYPFRRYGKYPWNLYTYTLHIRQWIRAVNKLQRATGVQSQLNASDP